jgi:hypothetical protein
MTSLPLLTSTDIIFKISAPGQETCMGFYIDTVREGADLKNKLIKSWFIFNLQRK